MLERSSARSHLRNNGQRVVAGQRLMQAACDIFLGWDARRVSRGERDFYVRQLRDWKGSAGVEGMSPAGMAVYGGVRLDAGPGPCPSGSDRDRGLPR